MPFLSTGLGWLSLSGASDREPCLRRSRMRETRQSGSGEGLGRVTGRGYSTGADNQVTRSK